VEGGSRGRAAERRRRTCASLSFFEEALGAIEDDRLAWRARNDFAVALAAVGQHDPALEQLGWCLELGTSLDDRVLEQHARANLAEVLRRGDRHEEAEVHARSALELARDLMDRDAEASALGNLALTVSDLGRWDEARGLYDEELAVALELGDRVREAGALGGLAACEFAAERPAEAADLYEQAARRDGGANPQQYVEDPGNALLAWTAAALLRKLRGSAQRMVRAAERLGLERLGAEFLHRTAAMLLQRGERHGALNLFGGAVRLVAARTGRLYASDLADSAETRPAADDGPDDDDEFLVHLAQELTEPLGKLVLAVEEILATASDRERFYAQLVDELDEHIPRFGPVLREMLAAVREGLARAGILPRGEGATPSEPDGSAGN
jgi:tetratricopeptide (TPR) repeat protein